MVIKPLSYEERITFGCSHAITVAYTDVTNTTLISLPVGTLVNNVMLKVTTNWNSGTSATCSVGLTSSSGAFITTANLLAAGNEYFIAAASTNAVQVSANQYLTVTLTVAGTAATAGALTIGVNIVDTTLLPS